MAKLIIITREMLDSSRKLWEKLIAEDPGMQEEIHEMHQRAAREKEIRDQEFAATHSTGDEESEEMKA